MSELYQSLAHSKWDSKYHVVFVPKRRRKAIFGQTRRQLGPTFHAFSTAEGMPEYRRASHAGSCTHVHGDSAQTRVASVIGFLKGKSASAMARLRGKDRNFAGEHFWARG
jgi:putative transposase